MPTELDTEKVQPTWHHDLPPFAVISFVDACYFALFGVVAEGDSSRSVSTLEFEKAARPGSILFGLVDEFASRAEQGFLANLRLAASQSAVIFFGRSIKHSVVGSDRYEALGDTKIDPAFFANECDFDFTNGSIETDYLALSLAEQDRVALAVAQLGGKANVRGLKAWGGVGVDRDSFLHWLAVAYPSPKLAMIQAAPDAPKVPSPTGRPKGTDRAVRQWMQDRVAAWPDNQKAPSAETDWQAAKEHFAPGLTRKEVWGIRAECTPPAWRSQGPRKLWGEARQSSSAHSAKSSPRN